MARRKAAGSKAVGAGAGKAAGRGARAHATGEAVSQVSVQAAAPVAQAERTASSATALLGLAGMSRQSTVQVDPAAVPMWLYYKEHRDELIVDVRLYREQIIAALRVGVSVEEAFAPYVRSERVVAAVAATSKQRTHDKAAKLTMVGTVACPWRAEGAAAAGRPPVPSAPKPSICRHQGASRPVGAAFSDGTTAGGRA